MIATTDQKARFLDLVTGVMELVRDGKRNIEEVSSVFQTIKDGPNFCTQTFAEKFEAWRSLSIGGVSKDELRARLGNGFFVSDWAKDIMSQPKFTTLPEVTEVHLTRAKVKDLGFTNPPTTTELFIRIKEVGDLCPAEAAPHLRLTDTDQPKNSWYWVAMEPITGSGGGPRVFVLSRYGDGERLLYADCICPGGRWYLGGTIVFRLSK